MSSGAPLFLPYEVRVRTRASLGDGKQPIMSDANIRIPAEVCDRLAEIAAAYGLSPRAYLACLAHTLLTPEERAERAAAR